MKGYILVKKERIYFYPNRQEGIGKVIWKFNMN